MKHYALIGEKLGHSLSVPIHEAIFQRLGIDADYRLIEIPRNEVISVIPRLLKELDGFNVTIPYKMEVIPLLDEIDQFASDIGAVNTVLCGQPSRGFCHFETDADVPEAMVAAFGEEVLPFIRQKGKKYYVNLKEINGLILRRAGVRHIEISEDCTMCRPDRFWSHRVTGGNRGFQGAVIVCTRRDRK